MRPFAHHPRRLVPTGSRSSCGPHNQTTRLRLQFDFLSQLCLLKSIMLRDISNLAHEAPARLNRRWLDRRPFEIHHRNCPSRSASPPMNRRLARKNIMLGLVLTAIVVVTFGLTFLAASAYLS